MESSRKINWIFVVLVIVVGIILLFGGVLVAAGPSPEIGYIMMVSGAMLIFGLCLLIANPDKSSLGEEISKFS